MTDFGEKVRREKQAVIRKPLVKSTALHCPLFFCPDSPDLAMSYYMGRFHTILLVVSPFVSFHYFFLEAHEKPVEASSLRKGKSPVSRG